MKLKNYIIFSLILILTSTATAFGGYFYGSLITKKKAELDKEAAVKGAIYDAKEKLNQEALEKAKEVVGESLDKNSSEAEKVINDFFDKISKEDYQGAYDLLSPDYKKSIYSASALKKDFSGTKVSKVEYRSAGELSALFSVDLSNEANISNTAAKPSTYFVRLVKDLKDTWQIENIEADQNLTQTKKSLY